MKKFAPASTRSRILAGIALATVAATAFTVTPAAIAEDAADALVADYRFTQTSGTTVENTADTAVGAATVVNGTDAAWTGDSLQLSGGAKTSTTANWVRLPDDILGDATSSTVTIETKFDASMLSNFNFLWNIGSESTQTYYFTSVRDVPRTAITTAGNGGEANARGTAPLVADRWYSITSVIDNEAGTISLYVDGTLLGSTATSKTPASIVDQTLNAIGRSPYPDPFYRGEVATFRVYDAALSADEIAQLAIDDGALHADEFAADAQAALDALGAVTIDDATVTLPSSNAANITWSSDTAAIVIADDGRTASVTQPAAGEAPLEATLTATAEVRGVTVSSEIAVTVNPQVAATDEYGYLMVHFIEDSDGYAEKIYLDVSRGDNPEQWDPLNDGRPILASQLGTTGIRDPFLTQNPETGTYYIIATDLRVFGGDGGSGSCTSWCYWTKSASTKLVVWESQDLVNWGEPRTFDTALDTTGNEVAELGMAWAPEALWVDDYYPDGSGAFVMYFSANVYETEDHSDASYNRVLWASTTDFTQSTYEFGGDFVNTGANTIDTTMIQSDGTTYRITKDNGRGNGIYMESTTATRWWEPETEWTTLQTKIGASWAGGNAGGVEGPAVFKSHSDEKWYLYVDVIPSTGYRPMVTTDLDAGWEPLSSTNFYMAPSTKHGGVVSLTKAQYDEVRASDAADAVNADLGSVTVEAGASADEIAAALPAETDVTLNYGRGTSSLPVVWDTSSIDTAVPGSYSVTGVVQSIGANLNDWAGLDGSTDWNAEERMLFRGTAITVTAEVVVAPSNAAMQVTVATRCVAGSVAIVTQVKSNTAVLNDVVVTTAVGARELGTVAADAQRSVVSAARVSAVDAGEVSVTATVDGASVTVAAEYAARTCG